MKKLIIFCLASLTFQFCAAKSIKSLVKKYDIIKLLPEQSDGNVETFWNAVVFNNAEFQSLIKRIQTKGGSAKKARTLVSSATSQSENHYYSYSEYWGLIDSLKYTLLGNNSFSNNTFIRVIPINEVNAFCTPNSRIFVFGGIFEALPKDNLYNTFLAVLAHEFAHGMMQHSLVGQYKKIKKEKSNKLWAGIAIGLNAFADGYAAAQGVKVPDNRGEYYASIYNAAVQDSYMYQFRYDREQEIQADIIAFRLLDWIGVGGESMIQMLNHIKRPYEYASDTSDHPTTQERIAILSYLVNKKRIKA